MMKWYVAKLMMNYTEYLYNHVQTSPSPTNISFKRLREVKRVWEHDVGV